MEYFFSDPHFGHANILKFERTQFSSIEEHDNFIIASINSVVSKNDTLYLLGDVGNLEQIKRLKGRIILIMGNHDEGSKEKYRSYFSEVYDTPIYITKRIVLSHIPIPITQGTLNVHGHLHGSTLNSENHFNVSAMLINYKPIPFKVLEVKVSKLEKDCHKFLGEWYAHLYKFIPNAHRVDVVHDENGVIRLEESIKLRDNIKHDALGYVIDCIEKGE